MPRLATPRAKSWTPATATRRGIDARGGRMSTSTRPAERRARTSTGDAGGAWRPRGGGRELGASVVTRAIVDAARGAGTERADEAATRSGDGADGGDAEEVGVSGANDADGKSDDSMEPIERKPFSVMRWVVTRTMLLGVVVRRLFAVVLVVCFSGALRVVGAIARNRFGRIGMMIGLALGAFGALRGVSARKMAAVKAAPPTAMYSAFLKDLKAGRISSVRFEEGSTRLVYDLKDVSTKSASASATAGRVRTTFQTKRLMGDLELMKKLEKAGVEFGAVPAAVSRMASRGMFTVLAMWLPIIPLIIIMRNAINRQQGGGGKKRKKAADINEQNKVTFKDVAGVEDAKAELFELVQIMKNSDKYKNVRGRLPSGCLLVGPPGTGKTLLARAVAGESGVSFFPVAASEFVELFVGRGAARVRELFAEARKSQPAIIFIDELDAVGSRRGAGLNEERDQTLNQLLVEMDGFSKDQSILILAATNRPDALDPALLRPGRLTRRVFVGPPSQQGRAQILGVHLRGLDLEEDVDVVCDVISRATPGFTGAELANVCNEAALLSVRDERQFVSIDDLLDGVSRTKDGIATSGNKADAMFRELRSRFMGNYKDIPGSPGDVANGIKEKFGSKEKAQGVPISMGPS